MKLKHFLLLSFGVFLLLGNTHTTCAQSKDFPVLDDGYYLVVGAFNMKNNAIRYANRLKEMGENARIAYPPHKRIHYVYVLSTKDLDLAKTKWQEYRDRSEFSDAWVFKNMPVDNDEFIEIGADQVVEGNIKSDKLEKDIFTDPAEKPENQPTKIEIPDAPEVNTGEGFQYIFNAINSTTLKEVNGFVTVVDPFRNKVITSLETNQLVTVPDPGTADKSVIFICDIFGFVKQQISVDLNDPTRSEDPNVSKMEDGTTLVNFELVRYKAGDIITMYNVYFYNDAAIMKEESKFELNSLLDMLQENEDLKIRIHGHTNGNAPGKIVKMAKGSDDFFSMDPSNITEGYGSAKELSSVRGETIQNWLISQGIDKKRMSVKGWGGKKMIYDKKSEQARRNVRVEIELLK